MHITAVLNALRCGVTASALLELLPGVSAQDILAAYVNLERARVKACHAWQELCADPTLTTLAANGADAAALMPVPVTRITLALAHGLTQKHIAKVVAALQSTIAEHTALIGDIEEKMAHPATPEAVRARLAEELHHPGKGGLWSDPYYLPNRVASLTSVRVADLLGERT